MKKLIIAGLMLAILAAAVPAFSQETKSEPKLITEMIKLKYLRANTIQNIITTYLSRSGRMMGDSRGEILTISDLPENIGKILSVIKSLDVKPAEFMFTIQLVLGMETDEMKTDDPLANDPIIRELRNVLKYKIYSLLDSALIRATDRERSQVTLGKNAELRLQLNPKYIKDDKSETIQLETELSRDGGFMQTSTPQGGQAQQRYFSLILNSVLSLKPGEKTVVGVSKMDGTGKALILIISGKIVS